MKMPQLGQQVSRRGEIGTVISRRIPPAKRLGGELLTIGEPAVTILFADGTKPPREVTVPESEWGELEIIEGGAE